MAKQLHSLPKRPRCFAADIMQLFPAYRATAINALPDDIRPLVRERVNTAITLHEKPLINRLAIAPHKPLLQKWLRANTSQLRKIVIANEVKQSPSLDFITLFGGSRRRASS